MEGKLSSSSQLFSKKIQGKDQKCTRKSENFMLQLDTHLLGYHELPANHHYLHYQLALHLQLHILLLKMQPFVDKELKMKFLILNKF